MYALCVLSACTIYINADDHFVAYINGQRVLNGSVFSVQYPLFVGGQPTQQVLAINATNNAQLSGLLVMSDEHFSFYTSPTSDWRCTPANSLDADDLSWTEASFDDSGWEIPTSRGLRARTGCMWKLTECTASRLQAASPTTAQARTKPARTSRVASQSTTQTRTGSGRATSERRRRRPEVTWASTVAPPSQPPARSTTVSVVTWMRFVVSSANQFDRTCSDRMPRQLLPQTLQ